MLSLFQHLFGNYSSLYPDELFPVLSKQINQEHDLISRKNFTGHVVADALILDVKKQKILLIYHKALQKWLKPGGHIDPEDTHPAEAARREVLEETGLKVDYVLDEHREPLLLHIDSHIIPLNEKKWEPEHWHHAMTFLFLADSTVPLPENSDEGIESCQWVEIEEALQDERMRDMLAKIELT